MTFFWKNSLLGSNSNFVTSNDFLLWDIFDPFKLDFTKIRTFLNNSSCFVWNIAPFLLTLPQFCATAVD